MDAVRWRGPPAERAADCAVAAVRPSCGRREAALTRRMGASDTTVKTSIIPYNIAVVNKALQKSCRNIQYQFSGCVGKNTGIGGDVIAVLPSQMNRH